MVQQFVRPAALFVLLFIVSSSPAAAQGIKFGPTFATFSSDALDFETRTGIHAGLLLGGSRENTVGIQTEFNWLRKKAGTQAGQESESITSSFP